MKCLIFELSAVVFMFGTGLQICPNHENVLDDSIKVV